MLRNRRGWERDDTRIPAFETQQGRLDTAVVVV